MTTWREFALWRDGLVHAIEGGLWLHRFTLRGEPWAHLVSADRRALLEAGQRLSLSPYWLQYRPLKDPRFADRVRVDAWHWDLRRERLVRALTLADPKVPYRTK